MNADDIRIKIDKLLTEKGLSYAEASRMLGKGTSYIHQYIKTGSPVRLNEVDRRKLAKILDVQEQEITDLDLSKQATQSASTDFIQELVEKVLNWIEKEDLEDEYTPFEVGKLVKLLYIKYSAAPKETRGAEIINFLEIYEMTRKAQ